MHELASTPESLAPLTAFVTYSIQAKLTGGNPLTVNQAYTSLTIILLVTNPAAQLLGSVPIITSSITCFDRIQRFLQSKAKTEERRGAPAIHGADVGRPESSQGDFELARLPSRAFDGRIALFLDHVTVKLSSKSPPVLRNVSVKAHRGQLTMVVGPIGSGKSTLVKVLLGELNCDSGTAGVASKRMGYCAQSPWLLSGSVRETICGPSFDTVDEKWYQTVLHACALEYDVASLPDDDRTVFGNMGMGLSGGQKQRLVCCLFLTTGPQDPPAPCMILSLQSRSRCLYVPIN